MSYKHSGIKILKALKEEPQYQQELIALIKKHRTISYKQNELYLDWIKSNEYASVEKIGYKKLGKMHQYDYFITLKSKGFDYLEELESEIEPTKKPIREKKDLNNANLSEIIQSNNVIKEPKDIPNQKEEKESIWNKPPSRALQIIGILIVIISIILKILTKKGII